MAAAGRRLLAAAVLAAAAAATAPAQDQPAPDQPVPEPYDPAEFAPALHHLRRAEIVAVGAFPFALLLSTLVYDTARWAGAGFAAEWAPFQDSFEDGEKVGIALAAVGVAVAVAVTDYLLGQAGEEPRYAAPPRSAARTGAGAAALAAPSQPELFLPSLATLWQRGAAGAPAAVAPHG